MRPSEGTDANRSGTGEIPRALCALPPFAKGAVREVRPFQEGAPGGISTRRSVAARPQALRTGSLALLGCVLLATLLPGSVAAAEGDSLVFCPFEPVAVGAVFEAEIVLDTGARVLGSYAGELSYDPGKVVIRDIRGGAAPEFALAPSTNPATFQSGTTPLLGLNLSSANSPSGEVSVARVVLENRAGPGDAYNFIFIPSGLTDPTGAPIEAASGACAIFVAAPTPVPTATPTPTPPAVLPCVGDCGGDGAVTVDEIITGVAIALGIREMAACPPFDGGGDGEVDVTEIVQAVNASLVGCPQPSPTPSPIPTATGTPTATATATATQSANRPPLLPPAGLYRAWPGEAIAYVVGGSDPDGGRLTYAATDLPAGASFDEEAGVLTWTPGEEQAGAHYIPVLVADDGTPPATTQTLLRFQVALPTTCDEATCDPATGCLFTPVALQQSCCTEGVEPARIAFAEAGCPQGGVAFAGRNVEMGIGRLENCDWVRVQNFAQTGAVVRLNFETRCLRPEAGIRVRVRLQAPSRVVIDDDLNLAFFAGENGYIERVTVPFNVLGGGPFFDLEFAEAQLTVILSDAFGNSLRTDKRVRLTFDRLPDLDDPVAPAP